MPGEDRREALCDACSLRWTNETLETCGICAKRVTECICMPRVMSEAGCEGFCKSLYYTPSRREPVQNKLIYRIKRQKDRRSSEHLARELSASVRAMLTGAQIDERAPIITYLPRSGRARRLNGTDQAEELAHALGNEMKLPVHTLILRRPGADQEQKNLSPAERLQNAKHSFLPNEGEDLKGRIVLLIDDIVTTGAGMSVCTRILRGMGAEKVFCAAIASDASNKDQPF